MSDKLERLQNQAMAMHTQGGQKNMFPDNTKVGLLSLYNRRRFHRFILIFKIVQNQQCPEKLVAYLPRRNSMHNKCLRGSTSAKFTQSKNSFGSKYFSVLCCQGLEQATKTDYRLYLS